MQRHVRWSGLLNGHGKADMLVMLAWQALRQSAHVACTVASAACAPPSTAPSCVVRHSYPVDESAKKKSITCTRKRASYAHGHQCSPRNSRHISCAQTQHSRDIIAVPTEVQCTARKSTSEGRQDADIDRRWGLENLPATHDCVFQLHETRLAANLIRQVPLPRYFFIHIISELKMTLNVSVTHPLVKTLCGSDMSHSKNPGGKR